MFLLSKVQTVSGAHPRPVVWVLRCLCTRVKRPGRETDPFSPVYVFMAYTGTPAPLPFHLSVETQSVCSRHLLLELAAVCSVSHEHATGYTQLQSVCSLSLQQNHLRKFAIIP